MELEDLTPRQFEQYSLDERIRACISTGIDTGLEIVEKHDVFEIAFEEYVYSSEELTLLRLFYFRRGFFACIRYKYPGIEMLDSSFVANAIALRMIEAEVSLTKLGI